MHSTIRIDLIKDSIKKDFGFYDVVYQKEVTEDLYFIAHDSKGFEDRIRVKSQLGMVYTLAQGNWRPAKGNKIELVFGAKLSEDTDN